MGFDVAVHARDQRSRKSKFFRSDSDRLAALHGG
jgi:hypothetical protein